MKEPYWFYAKMLDFAEAEAWGREITGRFAGDNTIKDSAKKFPKPKDQIRS